MSDKPQKINIGFEGGPAIAARVSAEELGKLRSTLRASAANGDGAAWHDLTSEDGTISLNLAKIVYVLADHEATRVGFGS